LIDIDKYEKIKKLLDDKNIINTLNDIWFSDDENIVNPINDVFWWNEKELTFW
jgi:hypothetical protein